MVKNGAILINLIPNDLEADNNCGHWSGRIPRASISANRYENWVHLLLLTFLETKKQTV